MRYLTHHRGMGKVFSQVLEGTMQAEREAKENMPRPLPVDTLWVRFVFVDHAGIPKCKAVHREAFEMRARAGAGLAKGVPAKFPAKVTGPGAKIL